MSLKKVFAIFLVAASLVFWGAGINVFAAKETGKSGYSEDVKTMNERHQAEMKELQERYNQDKKEMMERHRQERKEREHLVEKEEGKQKEEHKKHKSDEPLDDASQGQEKKQDQPKGNKVKGKK